MATKKKSTKKATPKRKKIVYVTNEIPPVEVPTVVSQIETVPAKEIEEISEQKPFGFLARIRAIFFKD